MKIKQMILTAISTVILFVSPQIFALNQLSMKDEQCKMPMKKIMDKVSLTAEQHTQMKSIMQNMRSQTMPYLEKIKIITNQINISVVSGKKNGAKLEHLINMKTSLLKKVIKIQTKSKSKMIEMLTSEQKIMAKQTMEKIHQNCTEKSINNNQKDLMGTQQHLME